MLHPITIAIREACRGSANPENAVHMRRYMKSQMPFYGIKSPELRRIQREILVKSAIRDHEEYLLVVAELWNGSYREERYCAIACARRYKEFITLEALPLYRQMIVTGSWWDYVDAIAAHLIGTLLSRFQEQMNHELYKMIDDDNVWIRRTTILAQLRFKRETDEEMLFEFCERCMEEKVFWIRKAIGWALREYSKSNPSAVRSFVEKHSAQMSGLTRREASKYL